MLLERGLPCELGDIAKCLAEFAHPIERVGFEAGKISKHLFSGLQAEGFDVVCMEARKVNAALSAMRNKTDRNDARGIAQIPRTGWFSPVHMKSREAHGLRALLSTRKPLLKKTMDLANEVLMPSMSPSLGPQLSWSAQIPELFLGIILTLRHRSSGIEASFMFASSKP